MIIAGAANLFVGAIKLVAGILAGSSAMLAEAAHSAADTLNRAQGQRSADHAGRRGSTSMLLGTVSQYVLRRAPCPVLVAPEGQAGAPA